MHISIATVFPTLYEHFLQTSLVGRAQKNGIVSFWPEGFARFVQPKEHLDAPTCGHTSGMIIRPEPVQRLIDHVEQERGPAFKIFFSPHGRTLHQRLLREIKEKVLSEGKNHMLLVAGRYEGVDARVEHHYADLILSVGDFVLMGGDIPAMMFIEGFIRLLPGVVGKQESVEQDSFFGSLVDYPEYCLPVEWKGLHVPEVLRSGNHEAIRQWRHVQAVERTVFGNFAWAQSSVLEPQLKREILAAIPPHYVVLMHSDVLVGKERVVGNTSVTSIDVHDIARSARTYGFAKFFIVTPLKDQQEIVATFLKFWQEGDGITYNNTRHEALKHVHVMSELSEVVSFIRAENQQKEPILIATSARPSDLAAKRISYDEQERVWEQRRPILIMLGTGQGLADVCFDQATYNLIPVEGLTEYKHLSVRSAAAIIFDRWLGLRLSFTK